MAIFGQFQITNNIDASASIEALIKFFSERLIDSVDTLEDLAKLIIKPVDDEIITESFLNWELTKPLENSILLEDLPLKEVQKGFSDTQPTLEQITNITIGKNLVDEANPNDGGVSADANIVYALDYFSQDYCEGLTFEESAHIIDLSKPISDISLVNDSKPEIQLTKNISDSVHVLSDFSLFTGNGTVQSEIEINDSISEFTYNKSLTSGALTNDSVLISKNKGLEDSINISESGLLDMNDYSLHYFSEPYVEKIYNF